MTEDKTPFERELERVKEENPLQTAQLEALEQFMEDFRNAHPAARVIDARDELVIGIETAKGGETDQDDQSKEPQKEQGEGEAE